MIDHVATLATWVSWVVWGVTSQGAASLTLSNVNYISLQSSRHLSKYPPL